jgi:hypothetical protein
MVTKVKGSVANELSSKVSSVSEGFYELDAYNGQLFTALSWKENGTTGGGQFVYQETVDKSLHNGGTIVSPSVPPLSKQNSLSDFLEGVGETDALGSGCFVRVNPSVLTADMFGAEQNGEDAAPSINKAIKVADNDRVVFDFEAGKFLIGSPITISGTSQVVSGSRSSIEPFGVYTGDAVVIEPSNVGQRISLPNIANFSNGVGLTVFGTNVADISIKTISGCNQGLKLKTEAATGFADKLLDTRVTAQQIGGCVQGIVFESDDSANVMQGIEVYCNFINGTPEGLVFDDLVSHTSLANWDSNLVQIQAYDPVGTDPQSLVINKTNYAVSRLTFKAESWVGGMDGASPNLISGSFNGSSFEISMAQSIDKAWTSNFKGAGNRVVIKNRQSKASQQVDLLTASNPSGFNFGNHLWNGRSYVKATLQELLPGRSDTFYGYHVLLGGVGASSRGANDSNIEVHYASSFPSALGIAAWAASSLNENEIVIRVTNTSDSTIAAGTELNLFLDVY